MNGEPKFKKGDLVTVCAGNGSPLRRSTIKIANTRRIVLSNGETWNPDGYPVKGKYPFGDQRNAHRLRATDVNVETLHALCSVRWADVPVAVRHDACELLKRAKLWPIQDMT